MYFTQYIVYNIMLALYQGLAWNSCIPLSSPAMNMHHIRYTAMLASFPDLAWEWGCMHSCMQ